MVFLEQLLLLLRLCSDVPRYPAEAICHLLRNAGTPLPPSPAYELLLNALWHHAGTAGRPQVIALVRDLQHACPEEQLAGIDQDLRAEARNQVT